MSKRPSRLNPEEVSGKRGGGRAQSKVCKLSAAFPFLEEMVPERQVSSFTAVHTRTLFSTTIIRPNTPSPKSPPICHTAANPHPDPPRGTTRLTNTSTPGHAPGKTHLENLISPLAPSFHVPKVRRGVRRMAINCRMPWGWQTMMSHMRSFW